METVLAVLFPLLLLVATGYAAVRFGLMTAQQVSGLGRFLVTVGLPLLIFRAFASRPLQETVQPTYLAAYAAASVCGFLFGWWYSRRLGKPPAMAALNGMGFGMANSGLIGFPLAAMAIGAERAGVFFAMNVLVEMLLVVPATLMLLDMARDGSLSAASVRRAAANLFKNPIMLGMLAGLTVSLSGITVPQPLMKAVSLLADATSPLALFVIGASLFGLAVQGGRRAMLALAAIRTLMFPTLVVGFLLLFQVPREVLMAGALFGSAAVPSSYALFAAQHGHGPEASALLLAVTLLSLLPVTVVLLLM